MAKSSRNASPSRDAAQTATVCRNRRARHDYDILDSLDCGIVLTGSEVKSIRNHRISIDEAYAKVEEGEVWLYNADIAEYPQANLMNHEPRRKRKLLLKRREIRKFADEAEQSGCTLIPLEVFFRRGIVKLKLAVARGRRQYDKREKLRRAEAGRAIREELRRRGS